MVLLTARRYANGSFHSSEEGRRIGASTTPSLYAAAIVCAYRPQRGPRTTRVHTAKPRGGKELGWNASSKYRLINTELSKEWTRQIGAHSASRYVARQAGTTAYRRVKMRSDDLAHQTRYSPPPHRTAPPPQTHSRETAASLRRVTPRPPCTKLRDACPLSRDTLSHPFYVGRRFRFSFASRSRVRFSAPCQFHSVSLFAFFRLYRSKAQTHEHRSTWQVSFVLLSTERSPLQCSGFLSRTKN